MAPADPPSSVETAWHSLQFAVRAAALADDAARFAADVAARHEALSRAHASNAVSHARRARIQRRNEACQRAAQKMHRAFAQKLEVWISRCVVVEEERPRLMSAVAATAGWQAAVVTLGDHVGRDHFVAASDGLARDAHDLEVTLAEGPSWDAALGLASSAEGAELTRRWPRYGPALGRLGVCAVAGVPLAPGWGGDVRGSLTVIATTPPPVRAVPLGDVADALNRTVLRAPGLVRADGPGPPSLTVFEDDVFRPGLHQAAGMLRERCGWSIDDAIALIRARAYADDRCVDDIAQEVVRGALLQP